MTNKQINNANIEHAGLEVTLIFKLICKNKIILGSK